MWTLLGARYIGRGLHHRPIQVLGGGPGVVAGNAAFHARVRGSGPGLGGLKKTKMFFPHPLVKLSILGSLCDQEVARLAMTGEQCHLIHLTILRMFSWPSLA